MNQEVCCRQCRQKEVQVGLGSGVVVGSLVLLEGRMGPALFQGELWQNAQQRMEVEGQGSQGTVLISPEVISPTR